MFLWNTKLSLNNTALHHAFIFIFHCDCVHEPMVDCWACKFRNACTASLLFNDLEIIRLTETCSGYKIVSFFSITLLKTCYSSVNILGKLCLTFTHKCMQNFMENSR
jgi:hypothetical protein